MARYEPKLQLRLRDLAQNICNSRCSITATRVSRTTMPSRPSDTIQTSATMLFSMTPFMKIYLFGVNFVCSQSHHQENQLVNQIHLSHFLSNTSKKLFLIHFYSLIFAFWINKGLKTLTYHTNFIGGLYFLNSKPIKRNFSSFYFFS